MTSKQREAAHQLHEWAVKDMHFTPQGRFVNTAMPSPEQLLSICRGQFGDIWKDITRLVYSAQTTAKIKGNLALRFQHQSTYQVNYDQQKNCSEGKAKLLKKRKSMISHLRGVTGDEDRIKRDVMRLQREIVIAEEEKIKFSRDISYVKRKTRLLEAHSLICKTDIARYEQYKDRLLGRLQHDCKQDKELEGNAVFFSRKGSKGTETLETACTKRVREACENITKFLESILEDNVDRDKMQSKREVVWRAVGKAVAYNQPVEVVSSLKLIAEETRLKLHGQTNAIDLIQDAKSLRFKYASSGHLRDMSTTPDIMHSVNQLILKLQLAHINQFTKTEKCKNHGWKLDQNLEHLHQQMKTKLSYLLAHGTKTQEIARKLFLLELNLAATKGTTKCLEEQIYLLTESVAKSTIEREILYSKYKQIQNFIAVSDDKQTIIKGLVRQNRDAKCRHERQQAELLQYMQQRLCSYKADVHTQSEHLQNGVLTHVEQFASLAFPLLEKFELEDNLVKVGHISINRFSNLPISMAEDVLQAVLELTKFPVYKASECLLMHLMELKIEVGHIQTLLDSQDQLHSTLLSKHSNQGTPKLNITVLSQDVSEHDAKQLKMVLPLLQTRLSETTQGLTQCLQVKDYLTSWWEQPSQHLTPWVQINEQTFKEWLTKWTVTVTRLRQISQ